jgi:magnesium transporter
MPGALHGSILASFMVTVATSPEETHDEWYSVMHRYGGVSATESEEYADILTGAGLPPPSNDATSYLTHSFLQDLGITSPGDRARIILSVVRMPQQFMASTFGKEEHSLRLGTNMGNTASSYQTETGIVRRFVKTSMHEATTWIDLVGKDEPQPDSEGVMPVNIFARELVAIKVLFNGTTDRRQLSQMRLSAQHTSANYAITDDDAEMTDMWGIVNSHMPLPHMIVDATNPSKVSFVLRVCTLGTSKTDASVGSLTNRWLVFVDKDKELVATVHRVDSVALAGFRDQTANEYESNSFKTILSRIFFNFLQEFEYALDSSNALLDECECKMLDHNLSKELRDTFFHLERKASVYERMIDLNQSLIHEVTGHFGLTKDIDFLEHKWNRLRNKAIALQQRSTSMLELLLSLSGHRTNELMAILTRFSMVFTPPTFITGLYGMNFVNMPELQYENGYYLTLVAIVAIMVVMSLWIRASGLG